MIYHSVLGEVGDVKTLWLVRGCAIAHPELKCTNNYGIRDIGYFIVAL
jgi:hypothetical protein